MLWADIWSDHRMLCIYVSSAAEMQNFRGGHDPANRLENIVTYCTTFGIIVLTPNPWKCVEVDVSFLNFEKFWN